MKRSGIGRKTVLFDTEISESLGR